MQRPVNTDWFSTFQIILNGAGSKTHSLMVEKRYGFLYSKAILLLVLILNRLDRVNRHKLGTETSRLPEVAGI